MSMLELQVPDMACAACVTTITNAVQAIDPNAIVDADPPSKSLKIQTDKPLAEIASSIISAGYTVR